jgi:AmiR/NasT family two-component response regulator
MSRGIGPDAPPEARTLVSAVLLVCQLGMALARRAVIDQAIGIVAARTGRGTDEAFGQLRLLARSQNITLIKVCQRIAYIAVATADE